VRFGLMAMGVILLLVPAGNVGASPSHAHPTKIEVVRTRSGPVLADGAGRTLYVFVNDLLTTSPSACTGDCANDWPPALTSSKAASARGITGHVGTIVRADGTHQLTLDGRPLYTFAGDRSRGDVRGNGIGNVWWAMTPSGLSATSFSNPKPTYGAPSSTTLTVVPSTFGPVVANNRGQVLYVYTDDTATTSACNTVWCLVDWPPLQVSGAPTTVPSVTAPSSVIVGAGGVHQVALAGHPLYTFAGDLHPGDTRGREIGDDWFLISPSGSVVGAKESARDAGASRSSSLAKAT
jgi:predicted lipoprotein with Yx(FWY)xxD motif